MVKHVYQSTKGYRIPILCLLLWLVVAMLTEAQFDRVIGKIIDTLFYLKSYEFINILLIYLAYFCANQVAYLFLNVIWMHLRNTYLLSIRVRCFEHLLNLKTEQLQKMKSGEFNKIVKEDVDSYLEYIYRVVFYIFGNLIFLLYALFYIFKTNIYLGYLTIAIMPFIFLGNKNIKDSIKNENASLHGERAKANAWITERISGISELIMLRANNIISKEYQEVNDSYNEKNIKINNTLFWNQRIIDFILLVGQLLLFCMGVFLVVNDKITVGSLAAIIGYYLTSKGLMASMYVKATNGFTAMTGIERVFSFLQREERKDNTGKILDLKNGNIRFESVSFAFEDKEILRDVSVDIFEGNKVAIVGENGSGKSTFMRLCYGLYHPHKGKVFLGDRNIEEYAREGLIKNIGVIQQKPMIYNNTIAFNIALENEVNEEWMYRILEELGLLYLFSDSFGLNSMIGREGRELSGGERQRITIARGIYRKPKILLLDEFTSSLDYLSSDMVEKAIRNLLPNCTIVYISHISKQIENADYLYNVKQGKMIRYEENI